MKPILPILLALWLTTACAAGDSPTQAQYFAAQAVVEAHGSGAPVTPSELSDALALIKACENPGVDWWALGTGALCAVLGVPALGGRGRQLANAFVGSLAKGDIRRATRAAVAYTGTAHSGPVLGGVPPPPPPPPSPAAAA